MSVRVRVRNFQSIKDAEIVIDGFAVVTGPNNSGKTALMRAIRGLFTNAPVGPYIRYGEASLSVEITFSDGATILWEKGWEKPDQKGKSINRYVVNGVEINNVGRGVPPEVEALGVCQINAGSDKIWPQIAEQFDGTLFLVNRSGSSVAEALSDVDKVGRLTEALKLSERDRRGTEGDLKLRKQDVEDYKKKLERYSGLDQVAVEVSDLQSKETSLQRELTHIETLRQLHGDLLQAEADVEALAGFDAAVIPDSGRAQKLRESVTYVRELQFLSLRLERASEESQTLLGFSTCVLPDGQRPLRIKEAVRMTSAFKTRLENAEADVKTLSGFAPPELTVPPGVQETQSSLGALRSMLETLRKAQTEQQAVDTEALRVSSECSAAEVQVKTLLGDRGVCPTCNSPHTPTTEAAPCP